MGIKSNRNVEGTRVIQATKMFTDRMTPRKSFWLKYFNAKKNILEVGDDVSVITYYGMGGIGKSTLLSQLEYEISNKITECFESDFLRELRGHKYRSIQDIFEKETRLSPKKRRFVRYDFKEYTDSLTALCAMADSIKHKYHYDFPLFEIAVYYYKSKIGEKWSYPTSQTKFSRGILSDVNSFVGNLSFAMLLSSTGINLIDSLVSKGRDIHKKKVFESHIKHMELATIDELYKQLSYYFSMDLNRNIDDEKIPFVFLLDTYEALVNYMCTSGDCQSNDLWLRDLNVGLITNIPNALFVIAGRNQLRWDKISADWGEVLEQHRIDELSKEDSIAFLLQTGVVTDLELVKYEALPDEDRLRIDTIIEVSRNVPLYLDICVNICVEKLKRNQSIDIEDFQGKKEELVERYYRYLSSVQQLYVKIFSCIGVWDDHIAKTLDQSRIFSKFDCDTVDYSIIRDSSIIKNHNSGKYSVHDLVSDIFLEKTDTSILDKCCEFLLHIINDKSIEKSLRDIYIERYLKLSQKDLESTLSDIQNYLGDRINEHSFELCERVMMNIEDRKDEAKAMIALIKIKYYNQKWDYASCKSYMSFNETDFRRIDIYKEYKWMCARIYYGMGEYDEAYEIDYKLYKPLEGTLEFDSKYVSLLPNLGCDLKKLGKYEEALVYFETYHDICLERYEITNALYPKKCYESALQHLGDVYFKLDIKDIALEFYEKDLALTKEIYESSLSIRDKREMMIAYRKVGDVHRDYKAYEKTKPCYMNYFRLATEINDQCETIRSKCSVAAACDRMGSFYQLTGDYNVSLDFFLRDLKLSEEIQQRQVSLMNEREVGLANINVGELYDLLHDKKKAMSYYKTAKTILEGIYAKQKTSINLNNLSNLNKVLAK
jgi:tetratricopeptide (TPR) repeat protein